MPIRLYNSLTKTKEDFAPIDAQNVRMYVCGPTVYDFAHIGNARPAIVFDVLYRLLRHEYGADHVTYARNFTDVDDKINARAAEVATRTGVSVETARAELTATTERQYLEDVRALGCLDPNEMPRATDHIGGMIAMIGELIARDLAYVAEGHVLFDVSKKADYGKLARRSLDDMIAGARVDVAPYKKGPMDFVLWKPSDAETPGWESPWGRGRPGWHIECSAMIKDRLGPGDTIDIHGGGIDLVFPHHENEIAQSEGAHHDHPLAKVWMHNGFLQVEGEKMSKSAGNFFTIRQLADDYPGGALRLAMLQSHYRQPINWMTSMVEEFWLTLKSWAGALLIDLTIEEIRLSRLRGDLIVPQAVISALSDDLNTPEAIAHLHELYHGRAKRENLLSLYAACEFLGVLNEATLGCYLRGMQGKGVGPDLMLKTFETYELFKIAHLNGYSERRAQLETQLSDFGLRPEISVEGVVRLVNVSGESTGHVEKLIAARLAARAAKNFAESDRIRDELLAQGIVLKDGPTGTTWEVKK